MDVKKVFIKKGVGGKFEEVIKELFLVYIGYVEV